MVEAFEGKFRKLPEFDRLTAVATSVAEAPSPRPATRREHAALRFTGWFEAPVVPRIGEVWELELRLRRPRGSFNPGGFDYESWLFRERIHATGYIVPGKRNRLLWAGSESSIDRFRAGFVDRAEKEVTPVADPRSNTGAPLIEYEPDPIV